MDIEQLLKEEEQQKFPPVNVAVDYSATIIVDNLPVIPREKEARLVGIVKKVFEHYGKIADFHMPFITEAQSAGPSRSLFLCPTELRCRIFAS